MIRKILGRLASARSFVFAALASFAASAFDTPYLTFRSASQFRLSGTSSRWSSGTLDIATSNPTDEASGFAVPDENFVIECDFYNLTLDSNLGDELEMPVLA